MTERVRRVAERIRQELAAIERVVRRAGRAMAAVRRRPDEQDLYLDSAALCLHDFYTGVERIFQQIAAGLDEAVPSGRDWHEALLQQMAAERLPDRPAVISRRRARPWRSTSASGTWCEISMRSSSIPSAWGGWRKDSKGGLGVLGGIS